MLWKFSAGLLLKFLLHRLHAFLWLFLSLKMRERQSVSSFFLFAFCAVARRSCVHSLTIRRITFSRSTLFQSLLKLCSSLSLWHQPHEDDLSCLSWRQRLEIQVRFLWNYYQELFAKASESERSSCQTYYGEKKNHRITETVCAERILFTVNWEAGPLWSLIW